MIAFVRDDAKLAANNAAMFTAWACRAGKRPEIVELYGVSVIFAPGTRVILGQGTGQTVNMAAVAAAGCLTKLPGPHSLFDAINRPASCSPCSSAPKRKRVDRSDLLVPSSSPPASGIKPPLSPLLSGRRLMPGSMNYDEAPVNLFTSHLVVVDVMWKAHHGMPALITREHFLLIQLKHEPAIIHGDVTVSALFAARYR